MARPGASVVRGVFVFFIAQLKNSLPNFNVGLTATEPVEATLAMKEQALEKATPRRGKPGRFKPTDELLDFLNNL
ncbi:hypothetical protein QFZ91_005284 [Paraburkholderia sp. JPY419]